MKINQKFNVHNVKGFLQRIKNKKEINGGGVVVNLSKVLGLCIMMIMGNRKYKFTQKYIILININIF